LILLPIRGIVTSENYPNNTVYKPFEVNTLPLSPSPFDPKSAWSFAYTPNNSAVVTTIMQTVGKEFNFNLFGRLRIFSVK
jgi:hypothetical protein